MFDISQVDLYCKNVKLTTEYTVSDYKIYSLVTVYSVVNFTYFLSVLFVRLYIKYIGFGQRCRPKCKVGPGPPAKRGPRSSPDRQRIRISVASEPRKRIGGLW